MNKRNRKIRNWILSLGFIALLFFAAAIGYERLSNREASMVRYPEFGISIPVGYIIHGIDVSRYQQRISWEEVVNMKVEGIRIGFAFIKATEGVNNVDLEFRRNWKRSHDAGITRGAYHFFLPNRDGRLQAEHFIKKVKMLPGDLPPVIDVEQLNGVSVSVLQAEVKEWLAIVEQHYGVKPIIYTNADFYKQYLDTDHFENYPLWVAHYYRAQKPRINRDWIMWQHSETGRVNGIISKVDFNVFNGDSLAFRDLLLK